MSTTTNCLEAMVGLRNVCDDEDYLLYIDDLPMIDVQLLSKGVSGEDVSGKNLFEKCRRLAAQMVSRDFTSALLGKVEFGSVLESEINGSFVDDTKSFTDIEVDKYYVRRIVKETSDPFVGIRLDYIELVAVNGSLCEKIYIWDGYDLTTKSVLIDAGVNRIDINMSGSEFYVFVSAENVSYQETDSSCYSDCGCCYSVDDYTSTDNTVATLTDTSIRPIKMAMACVCLKQEIVCRYKNELSHAMRFMTAANIFDYIATSRRDNPLIRSSRDDAKDKLASLIGGADSDGSEIKKSESKYWPELWNCQKQVKVGMISSDCVACRGVKLVSAF